MCWFKTFSSHLPAATGPYVPGLMDVMVDYSKDGFFARFYYPTNARKNDEGNFKKWLYWIADDSYFVGIANVLMVFACLLRALLWWGGDLKIPALFGEKPKTTEKLQPIIFSHGLGGNRFLYTNVCCELASRGYLVVALEHRDYSACNTYFYASKKAAENDQRSIIDFKLIKLDKDHFTNRHQQVSQRAEECIKVLDFLLKLNNGEVPHNVINDVPSNYKIDFNLGDFVGKIDVDCVTAIGHSFGGATALLAMSRRKEFKQGILLDPWMFSIKTENLPNKIQKPLLFINTQTFHIKTNVDAMAKYLTGENRKMYTILHTTHEHQTDTVLLCGSWLNWFMKKLPPLEALHINNSLILTFLNEYSKTPSNILDCHEFLEQNKIVLERGITKPWA